MENIYGKIRSIKLCMMAHPDNEEHSEFADRISDLEELELEFAPKTQIVKKEHPILGVSCPICGSVFSVQALHTKFFNEADNEENARIVKELMEYAMQGLEVKIYSGKDYNFHYCEHVKGRSM